MSWGTCYSGSNNIHFDYPPLMSDGRNFANWNSACSINDEIISQKKIQTNYQYRQYLIKNADGVIRANQIAACNDCCTCQYGNNNSNNNPTSQGGKYLYQSCADSTQPFGYENSDLKNMYISRQALQSRLSAPLISQQGLMAYPRDN